jgi:hypothetical protein
MLYCIIQSNYFLDTEHDTDVLQSRRTGSFHRHDSELTPELCNPARLTLYNSCTVQHKPYPVAEQRKHRGSPALIQQRQGFLSLQANKLLAAPPNFVSVFTQNCLHFAPICLVRSKFYRYIKEEKYEVNEIKQLPNCTDCTWRHVLTDCTC